MAGEHGEDKRTKRTVAAIKAAFWELAKEKGFDKVTVSDIAKHVDMNRKTFYHHFDSIETLREEIIKEHIEQVAGSLRDSVVVKNGELDVRYLFEAISAHITFFASRRVSLAGVDTEKFISYIEPILVQAMLENAPELFEGVSDQGLRYVATFFCAGLTASYRRWLADDSEMDMSMLAEILSASIAGSVVGVKKLAQFEEVHESRP